MNVALSRPMTMQEFLAWEERQELRFEFDGVQPVAMTVGTVNHETIVGNLISVLRRTLRAQACRPFGPTLKIEVAGRIRYPDAFIACGPLPGNRTVVAVPVVVFEVLSPSTSRVDRIEKLREYQGAPSILRYIILEQDSMAASVYARHGSLWNVRAVTEGEMIEMPEIGANIPLSELYEVVEFPTGSPPEASVATG